MKKLSLIRSSVRLSSIPRFANLALAFWLAFAMVATQAGEDNGKGQSLQTYPQPLIAWSFADAEGTFVPDVTGHGYDATIYDQPQFVHRWDYVALAFDGSGANPFWTGAVRTAAWGSTSGSPRHLTSSRLQRGFASSLPGGCQLCIAICGIILPASAFTWNGLRARQSLAITMPLATGAKCSP